MVEVIGGNLWQWDTGRRVRVVPDSGKNITEVQFYNGVGTEGLLGVFSSDGVLIPDVYLQSCRGLIVYAVFEDSSGKRTVEKEIFGIKSRPKPPDYEETDNKAYIAVDETDIGKMLVNNNGIYSLTDEIVIPKEYGRITYDHERNITIS